MGSPFIRGMVVFALCAAAQAQDAITFGSIAGVIRDPAGGAVSGAQVSARRRETNQMSSVLTGREGRYRLPYLKAGEYELAISMPGFAQSRKSVSLSAGSAFVMDVTLQLAGEQSTVTVSGESALVETARTQVSATVTQREVQSLPLNGRNFLDLALLVPGVSPTNTGSNQQFAETSGVPGQGISVGSQRNFSNSFLVDGLSANDDAAGLSGVSLGLDTVQEFQVVTSGGQAELGRALGGYVNVITRSGGNAVHGDLYGYFRNQRLNAANPLSNAKLPSTQSQYGASFGGPLRRDRTFYFGNFEQRLLNQSGLVTISPENAAAINTRLDAVSYPGARVTTGLYPNPVHHANALGKLDHQFGTRDQVNVRYSLWDANSRNSRGAGALNAPSASAWLDNRDQTIAFGNVATLSARTVNETRGQYTRSVLAAPPSDPTGPAVTVSGVGIFGTLSGSPVGRRNGLYEVADNYSQQRGAHALRAGLDFLYNDLTIDYPRSVRGAYTFSSMANFLTGVYNNSGFTQTFGNRIVALRNPNLGMYLQDEWKVGRKLTFNAGVRYDLQGLKTIATDTDNVSPRLGFAWSPFERRSTVVRGGAGLFYDRVPLRALANALLSAENTTTLGRGSQVSLTLSPAQSGAPVFPLVMDVPPSGLPANVSTMNRRLQNAYAVQANLEIEHQIGERTTVSAGYQHLRGVHLLLALNRNAPTCVASGGNNGCRPDASIGNNSQYSSLADSRYDGLHVSLVQRAAKWASYRVSYTFSKALDNVGEFFFSAPIDNGNIWRDYGRSDDDQRHRVVVNGVARARGFQLSGMLQYYSALPMNIVTGATTLQGTAARPVVNGDYIGRNSGAGNDFFSVGTRVTREFRFNERVKVEAIGEAFNALNHRNNLTRNSTFGPGLYPMQAAASFNQVTAVQDSRSMQVALRVKF